jgi:ElaB/YqjD/DUF883 family membrane-anchored ribosome-binding protein
MTNEIHEPPFPQTRQDISNLKQTAVDAAKDLGSTASVHAKRAQGQLADLTSHAQEEGAQQVEQVKVKLSDVGSKLLEYVTANPLASVGTALAIGFLIGFSRRGSRS